MRQNFFILYPDDGGNDHRRPFGFLGKGNTFFHSEVAYTVPQVSPVWLVRFKGVGIGLCGHTLSRLAPMFNSITAHWTYCGRPVLQ